VNTKKFAEILLNILKKAGVSACLVFGDMTTEERDEYVQKFRDGSVKVLITTNMLARGVDVPETQLVINFDVPLVRNPDGS
jgi:ATP-dependent RNA helicase DDX19/DBP5